VMGDVIDPGSPISQNPALATIDNRRDASNSTTEQLMTNNGTTDQLQTIPQGVS